MMNVLIASSFGILNGYLQMNMLYAQMHVEIKINSISV